MVKESISINPNTRLPRSNKRSRFWVNPLSSEELKYFNKVYNVKETERVSIGRELAEQSRLLQNYFKTLSQLIINLTTDELLTSIEYSLSLGSVNLELTNNLSNSVGYSIDLTEQVIELTSQLSLYESKIVDLELNSISLGSDLTVDVQIGVDLSEQEIVLNNYISTSIDYSVDLSDLNILNSQTVLDDFDLVV